MGIQLWSISHKTAPASIRACFAFQKEQQERILEQLIQSKDIKEAVLLATCNRTELYCSGEKDNRILKQMQEVMIKAAKITETSQMHDYIRRYYGERAVHHLFMVAAGLDSMVLGEDQILGQVRQAYFRSKEHGFSQSNFNNLFRLAITAAKKVKTDTMLSKTSVSTASLALKKAEECHGGLAGKNLMIIGASGQIGNIVLKDALDVKGLKVYVTVRKELPKGFHHNKQDYSLVPYQNRYDWMNEMDVVISATASPHFTITKERFLASQTIEKKRVFFDLAVPMDIEESIGELLYTHYFNLEDIQDLARQNQELKQNSVSKAKELIQEYENRFYKNLIYSQNMERIQSFKQWMVQEAERTGLEKVLDHFFFEVREEASVEEWEKFMEIVNRFQGFQV